MELCVFHSVNSGLYLWDGAAGLLVDGIHDGPDCGMSPMPASLVGQLNCRRGLFAHTDGVLFTHLHRDHFQRWGLRRLLSGAEIPVVYGPGLDASQIQPHPAGPGMCRLGMAGAHILAGNTLHDGAPFRSVPHQSYLIRMGGETLFIAGDAVLTASDAASFSALCTGRVDAGFFNVYQLLSAGGQGFIRLLRPSRILLEHLPFPEDDSYHFWDLAKQVGKYFPPDLPRAEILPHMSWIDGRAPRWGME